MRLAHTDDLSFLRTPTADDPWRILISGCLAGLPCGVDGTDYGMGGHPFPLFDQPTVRTLPFCPEDAGIGTPRGMPDLHGGDGFAVLDGTARMLDHTGLDVTERMLDGARQMLAFAQEHRVDFALLTDMSGACGSQVIADGCRFDEPRRYQLGSGVASAMLQRAGIPVVSQRDDRTVGRLRAIAEPAFVPEAGLEDHHQREWTREYFGL